MPRRSPGSLHCGNANNILKVAEDLGRLISRRVVNDDNFILVEIYFPAERLQALESELGLVENGDDDRSLDRRRHRPTSGFSFRSEKFT